MIRYIKYILLFVVLISPTTTNSHPNDYYSYKIIEMDVYKDNQKIGFSNYFFNYNNGILEVVNETKFEVKLLGVKVFSINSNGLEKYFENKLISFNSETYQNDKRKYVNLKLSEDKKEFQINGSSFKGTTDIEKIVGSWWNHDILEMNSQISPVSGSVKGQIVKTLGKQTLILNNIKYETHHYKLLSKDPNTPDDKKLNFDIWLDKSKNLIVKIAYNKLGQWEYRIKNFKKN